jgi:hypothetical protein
LFSENPAIIVAGSGHSGFFFLMLLLVGTHVVHHYFYFAKVSTPAWLIKGRSWFHKIFSKIFDSCTALGQNSSLGLTGEIISLNP